MRELKITVPLAHGVSHAEACFQSGAFKCIDEEVSEPLDGVPAQFFVLRHIGGASGAQATPSSNPVLSQQACSCPLHSAGDGDGDGARMGFAERLVRQETGRE